FFPSGRVLTERNRASPVVSRQIPHASPPRGGVPEDPGATEVGPVRTSLGGSAVLRACSGRESLEIEASQHHRRRFPRGGSTWIIRPISPARAPERDPERASGAWRQGRKPSIEAAPVGGHANLPLTIAGIMG